MQRLAGARELLDGPLDERVLAGNLRDLVRANRLLGGVDLSWRALYAVLEWLPHGESVSMLDVGTGAADIPLALAARAASAGRQLDVQAVDMRPEIIALARARVTSALPSGDGAGPQISVSLSAGAPYGFPDESFDVVHASLVLHHHDGVEAERLLAEMARLARRAIIVNDLERARRWLLGAWLLTRLATANRYTRHDAPLSVRRAYTASEVSGLAAAAGLEERARFHDRLGHRYALVLAPRR